VQAPPVPYTRTPTIGTTVPYFLGTGTHRTCLHSRRSYRLRSPYRQDLAYD